MVIIQYDKRLQKLFAFMASKNIDVTFVMMSSDLQYLTGIERPRHNPTDDDKHGDHLYGAFISPEKGVVIVVPRMGASSYVKKQAQDKPWVKDILVLDDGDDTQLFVEDVLQHFGQPRRLGVTDRLWYKSAAALQKANPTMDLINISTYISHQRAIKDRDELAIMRQGCQLTDQVFAAVLKQLRLGMTAYDVEYEINHQIQLHGGTGTSFHTQVVISHENLTLDAIQPGSVITFDFGMVYQGYATDFGRTVFCGEPKIQLLNMHDWMMKAQATAIDAMVSKTITAAELNQMARQVLADVGVAQYFTHRLGHGIGIDVHEKPFLFELDESVLQTGMCFTIEPSIRIPDSISLRVEDIVLVTETGGEPLSSFSRDYVII